MIYEIDGSQFSNLEEFWSEAEKAFSDFISEVGAFGRTTMLLQTLIKEKQFSTIW